MRTIAISDIHGHYDEFIRLLDLVSFEPEKDKLYLLGDYVDKGPDSKKVIQHLLKLSHYKNVKIIGGNHDDLFLNWLKNKDYRFNYTGERSGGVETISSFFPNFKKGENEDAARDYILRNYQEEIQFLQNLPYYIEDDGHIYVHAGVDFKKSDWKETSEKDFRWIRKPFLDGTNPNEKTVVFGHTVTASIRMDENDFSVWFSDKKIAIDGGLKFGGQLNALVIEDGKYKCFSIK